MRTLKELDHGGFGRVDIVETPEGDLVARKTFDPYPGSSGEEVDRLRQRFLREVRFQETLEGDFFMPVLETFPYGQAPWFTMPLAEFSLEQQIGGWREGGFDDPTPLFDVLRGLEALHGHPAVHRDLKPANVLLFQGKWRLIDFGLVLYREDDSSFRTATRQGHGTTAYMAPEQHGGFGEVTSAADVYAFGCILHDVFGEGERIPFQRYTADGPIGGLIEACTELNPLHRLQSAVDVRRELEIALADPTAEGGPYYDWVRALDDVSEWSHDLVRDFASAIRGVEGGERARILESLSEGALEVIFVRAPEIWKGIAQEFVSFVRDGQFHYLDADRISGGLANAFDHGGADLKARAIIAMALLGDRCNRFRVMERLLAAAGRDLDEGIAQRVGMEIRRAGLETSFRNCVAQINRGVSDLHPRIAQAVGS